MASASDDAATGVGGGDMDQMGTPDPAARTAASDTPAAADATAELGVVDPAQPDAVKPSAGKAKAGAKPGAATARRGAARKRQRAPRWVGRVLAVAALVILAAVIAYFVFGRSGATAATYQTATAEQGTLTVTVNGSGSAVVGRSASVVPPVSGIVEDVQVKLGEHVSNKEVLFTLKNEALLQAVQQSRASVKQAQQQLSSAKLTLMQADQQLDQTQQGTTTTTRTPGGTTTTTTVPPTEDELQIAEQRVVVAEKGVTAARASLASAKTGYAEAQANYAARIVIANMTGTLTTFNVTQGLALGSSGGSSSSSGSSASGSSGSGTSSSSSSSGSSSSSSANIVISDLASMKAQVAINEVDLPSIKVGQQATVTFDSISGLTITGVVSAIAPQGTSSSGVVTYLVDIAFDVQNPKVKPGMTCSADIVTQQIKDTVLVPNAAAKSDTQGSYVMVVTLDSSGKPVGQATRQDVTTGASNDTMTQIVSGLKAGQTVVTSSSSSTSGTGTNSRGGFGAVFGGGRPPGN